MIASHLNTSYMAGEPVVIVPAHTMQVTPNSSYYYGTAVRLGPQSGAPAISPFYDGHAPAVTTAFGSASRPQALLPSHFPSLALAPAQHLMPMGNEMAVDETAPLSPSSSNSTEQDDEESAAAILYALESGSLSPRNSPLHNSLHSTSRIGMKQHRRMAVSPLHVRRKRVASLSEVQSPSAGFGGGQMFGKESADDYEGVAEEYGSASPMNDSPLAASVFASSPYGSRPTSWSLPSHSPLGYTGFTAYNSPSVSLRGAAAASSPTSTPIPIPRAKPAFSPYHPSSPSSSAPLSGSPTHAHKKSNKRQSRARLDNHQCPNCHTSDSPLWRNCLIKGKILHLCNSCGLRYKKHKYCPHCYKVYYDADTNAHDWAQCIACHNWTHRHCLDEAGIDASLPGSYKCLRCLGLLPDCD